MHVGRPVGSEIRQNIVELLYYLKKSHGYKIYQLYLGVFPAVSLRSIYYHLKKGEALGEFKVEARSKAGEYSWGGTADILLYSLGENANPVGMSRIKEYIQKLGL